MARSQTSAWRVLLLVAASFLSACAAGSNTGGVERQDPNLLTTAEIEGAGYSDAYSVVEALRPRWLWRRGSTTINQQESVKVYLDGSLLGGPEYLRQIRVRSIASIRFMDGLEASNRWGLDHGLGAIIVSTRQEGS